MVKRGPNPRSETRDPKSPAPGPPLLVPGLVHVYTGDGKGKTTAALGLALRALGWGLRVCFVQFVKGYAEIGEMKVARRFEGRFEIKQFAIDLQPGIGEARVLARSKGAEEAMRCAESVVAAGEHDMVVLDEINVAIHYGLIDIPRVLALICSRPGHVELVLTGRNAKPEVMEAADYVTEFRKVKHPFDKGIAARKGVDL